MECACNDNEYCCSTDTPSVSFPLQASGAHFSVKASTSKQIHRVNSKGLLCAFVAELHYDMLFLSQKNFGTSTEDPQSAVLIVTSVTCSASGRH